MYHGGPPKQPIASHAVGADGGPLLPLQDAGGAEGAVAEAEEGDANAAAAEVVDASIENAGITPAFNDKSRRVAGQW